MPHDAPIVGKARPGSPSATAAASEADTAAGQESRAEYVRLGMTVFDEPDRALETVRALTGAGLEVDQVGLIALEPVMSRCATLSSKWPQRAGESRALFERLQQLCVLADGAALFSTSWALFDPIRRAVEPDGHPAGASRAREHRDELDRLLRSGAVAVVARAADSRQQQTITRLLLANSLHRVTTYDLPRPAPRR